MIRLSTTIAALILLTGSSFPALAEPQISEAELMEVVQDFWANHWPGDMVDCGLISLFSPGTEPVPTNGYFLPYEQVLDVLEGAGLVTVTDDRDPRVAGMRGLEKTINVEPTQRLISSAIARMTPGCHFMIPPFGTRRVVDVVQTKALVLGTDDFVFGLLRFQMDFNDYGNEFLNRSGVASDGAGRAKVLVQFDPFASAWAVVAHDETWLGTEFYTNYVETFTGSH